LFARKYIAYTNPQRCALVW